MYHFLASYLLPPLVVVYCHFLSTSPLQYSTCPTTKLVTRALYQQTSLFRWAVFISPRLVVLYRGCSSYPVISYIGILSISHEMRIPITFNNAGWLMVHVKAGFGRTFQGAQTRGKHHGRTQDGLPLTNWFQWFLFRPMVIEFSSRPSGVGPVTLLED